ncbi:MAG: hypothetical protein H6684_07650 [Deltaproteobacteria bacterium]|nr:hypothetical protein [Deltaproteobacteria bacterium]
MKTADEAARRRFALGAVTAAVVLYLLPLFKDPSALMSQDAYRSHDYLQQATYDFLFRDALLTHHQFPFRTHLLGGGYPLPANPQDVTFSPFVITTFILGQALGMKLNILIFFLIGATGMFVLARERFDATTGGALVAAVAYATSGWWLSRLEWGFYFKNYFHFVPWIWVMLERACEGRRTVFWAGLFLAVVVTQLGLGYAVIGFFFLLYLPLSAALSPARSATPGGALGWLVAAFGISVIFAAAKVLPMIGLLLDNVRAVDNYDLYTGVGGGYPHFYQSAREFLLALVQYSPIPNRPIEPGWIALALALVGVIAAGRRLLALWVVGIYFLLLCFGPFLPVDLFKPLWHLPFFHSMHAPYQLFSYFVLVALCVSAGVGASWIEERLPWGLGPSLGAALATLLLAVGMHWSVMGQIFTEWVPRLDQAESYFQVQGRDMVRGAPRTRNSQQYFNALRGVGTIDWDGDVLLPENVIPAYFVTPDDSMVPNMDYPGEAWMYYGQGEVTSVEITPNRLKAAGTAVTNDFVVFNQNFSPYFDAAGMYRVFEFEGRVAVEVEAGDFEITVNYWAWPQVLGVMISLLSLGALAYFVLTGIQEDRRTPPPYVPPNARKGPVVYRLDGDE